MSITINNIDKHFINFHALKNISLTIDQGELITLLGPSGCGKTTLLRIIAGLEIADRGQIFFNNKDITHLKVNERNVGFVFQHYTLFKHMSVFENIAFGLRVKNKKERKSEQQIKEKVYELLNLIQLNETADRYPNQLSGGQRQRVALARALATDPKILLLDEPFGALDAKVRKELRRWLRLLHNNLNITSIFVTHDQEEAFDVSDRIVIMNEGKIEQVGSAQDIIDEPNSSFVYGFLGHTNIFSGKIIKGELFFDINNDLIKIIGGNQQANGISDKEIKIFIRPYDFSVVHYKQGENGIIAKLQNIIVLGHVAKLEMLLLNENNNKIIDVELSLVDFFQLNLKIDDQLLIAPKKLKYF